MQREQEGWTATQLHAAGRLPMSSAHAMNARKCVHSKKKKKKNYLSQAVTYELRKVGGRGKKEKKRDGKDRG